jgi:hypothetical protein
MKYAGMPVGRNTLGKMVRPGGLELPTFWFVARRSIQLSYGRTGMNAGTIRCDRKIIAQLENGIERVGFHVSFSIPSKKD